MDLIDRQEAIASMKETKIAYTGGWNKGLALAIDRLRSLPTANVQDFLKDAWIPILDGDGQMPEVDEDGESEYVLISFANFPVPTIGRYQVDEEGGAFYDGDDDEPLIKIGLIVNAWMPLPARYKEDTE